MTQRDVKKRFVWVAVLGLLSTFSIPLAVAAEGNSAVGTFFSAAEKFGIYATINLLLIGCTVYFLYRIVNYAIGRLEAVVDDNTLCFHRFTRAMAARPCISDSDVDRIIEPEQSGEDSNDAVVRRVIKRRQERQERGI
jgi:hypothetical protein